jgi:hypothetical protein
LSTQNFPSHKLKYFVSAQGLSTLNSGKLTSDYTTIISTVFIAFKKATTTAKSYHKLSYFTTAFFYKVLGKERKYFAKINLKFLTENRPNV